MEYKKSLYKALLRNYKVLPQVTCEPVSKDE